MTIIVYDVPAETGGALTILKEYYKEAKNKTEINWIFVVSTPELASTNNIKVLSYPWVKKSWVHRLYFDLFVAPSIVKKYDVDEILSLQNVCVSNKHKKQSLYLHQPLPFSEIRYKLHNNPKFWIYQNIISKMIYKSIYKADIVIVQTKWMKDIIQKKLKLSEDKIIIKRPVCDLSEIIPWKEIKDDCCTFFYPAGAYQYKNHKVIVDAVKKLSKVNTRRYKVIFTISGDENNYFKKIKDEVKELSLPIEFVGSITQKEVFFLYSKSILIFPSCIETFGLPLLEARQSGAPILSCDMMYAHEVIGEYDKVKYFSPYDEGQLSTLMEKYLKARKYENIIS